MGRGLFWKGVWSAWTKWLSNQLHGANIWVYQRTNVCNEKMMILVIFSAAKQNKQWLAHSTNHLIDISKVLLLHYRSLFVPLCSYKYICISEFNFFSMFRFLEKKKENEIIVRICKRRQIRREKCTTWVIVLDKIVALLLQLVTISYGATFQWRSHR